jgi:hypothetical protein
MLGSRQGLYKLLADSGQTPPAVCSSFAASFAHIQSWKQNCSIFCKLELTIISNMILVTVDKCMLKAID